MPKSETDSTDFKPEFAAAKTMQKEIKPPIETEIIVSFLICS